MIYELWGTFYLVFTFWSSFWELWCRATCQNRKGWCSFFLGAHFLLMAETEPSSAAGHSSHHKPVLAVSSGYRSDRSPEVSLCQRTQLHLQWGAIECHSQLSNLHVKTVSCPFAAPCWGQRREPDGRSLWCRWCKEQNLLKFLISLVYVLVGTYTHSVGNIHE